MDKAGLSAKTLKPSAGTQGDIPQAVRDNPVDTPAKPQSQSRLIVPIGGIVGLGALALGLGAWFGLQALQAPVAAERENDPTAPAAENPSNSDLPTEDSTGDPTSKEELLGHFVYEEALPEELQAIAYDGSIKLRSAAANAFLEMEEAARRDGVILRAISGFRSEQDQEYLFFKIKEQRGQANEERAQVSAPPGYSEHHTGYAIDIGDGDVPATDVMQSFENTRAFKWLQANASSYSFELSFPKNNPQGVAYEPWHWRFVGDRHSLELFYKPRSEQE